MNAINTMHTKLLITCENIQEANLIQGRLKNEGIDSIVSNSNFTTLMPHFNGMLGAGVQVLVRESDYDKSKEVLQLDRNNETQVICPHCKSANTKFGLGAKKNNKIITIVLSILFAVPFGNIKNTFYCLDCKLDFNL